MGIAMTRAKLHAMESPERCWHIETQLQKLASDYALGKITRAERDDSMSHWLGMAKIGDDLWRLRERR